MSPSCSPNSHARAPEIVQPVAPSRVRIAVLLDKPVRREVDLRPEYVGFRVPDRWVVGYGLDDGGMYRNLPYISYVE